ncbi:MAG: HD domain-containing protein [Clostridiales bacterium]|nr:HD domain-containing protein [Clostridiales bacterium]
MDLKKADEVFRDYLKQYDAEDDKIRLKIAHTYGVVTACKYIAKNMQLQEEDAKLAELIGLLHDIGRFEQLRIYHSFDDSLMPHAQCSIDILFKQNMIEQFLEERHLDEIIYLAIKYHGVYQMPDDMPKRGDMHTKIIRDADKLDNFRVKHVSNMVTMVDVDEKELGTEPITEEIYEKFLNHTPILNSERKTHMDMWVSYLGYIFDLNYPASFQYIKEKDYINKIVDRVPYTNPDTKEKMEQIRKTAQQYVDQMAEQVNK